MINEPAGWRELPFHEELRELTIVGSGKARSLLVRVPDGRGFGIPLGSYGGRVSVKRGGRPDPKTAAASA